MPVINGNHENYRICFVHLVSRAGVHEMKIKISFPDFATEGTDCLIIDIIY